MVLKRCTLVVLLALVTGGCALRVTLTATPNPTLEGQNVLFSLGVTNLSNCALDPVVAYVGVLPPEADVPPYICSLCQDAGSVEEMEECLEEILGIDFAQQLTAQARFRAVPAADSIVPVPAGVCGGDFDTSVQCAFDPIGPLGSDSVQFSVPAPASGPVRYMAFVAGATTDPNCPVIDIPEFPEEGAVFGCALASAEVRRAPVLSPHALGGAATVLLAAGLWGLWRRRRVGLPH